MGGLGLGSLATMIPGLIQTGMGAVQSGKDNIQNILAGLGNAKLLQTDADILGRTQGATGNILNQQYGYMLPEFQRNEGNLRDLNQQRWAQQQNAQQANYQNALSGMNQNEVMLRNDLANQYGTTMGSLGSLQGQLRGGYAGQERDVMGLMDQMGNTARQNIQRNWAQQGARTQQGLTDSGMANTTVGAQLARGNTRGLNQDLGSLEESIRTQKAGQLANMRAQALASQQALGQYGTGMQADMLGNQTAMLANQADTNWGRRADMNAQYGSDTTARMLEMAQMADAESQARQGFAKQYAGDYTNWLNNNYGQYDAMLRNIQIPYSQNTGQAMMMEGLGGVSSALQSSLDREAQKRAAHQQASAAKTAAWTGGLSNLMPNVGLNWNYGK